MALSWQTTLETFKIKSSQLIYYGQSSIVAKGILVGEGGVTKIVIIYVQSPVVFFKAGSRSIVQYFVILRVASYLSYRYYLHVYL